MKYLMLAAACLGVAATCSEKKTSVEALEGKWAIIEVGGEKIEQERMPSIEFNMAELKVHGNTGCNSFSTVAETYPDDASRISLKPATATMMACLDMEVETKIFRAFGEVHSIAPGESATQMLVLSKDGEVLLVLSKQ